jgi:hypothetical protein
VDRNEHGQAPGLSLTLAWLRRRRVVVVVALVAGLCLTAGLLAPERVVVGGGVVRTVLFAGMGVSMSTAVLLQPAFGVLERSFVRAGGERVLVLVGWALVTAAAAISLWCTSGGPTAASWMLLLSGSAGAAVTWRSEAGWWAPLSLGLGGIALDAALPVDALTRALADLGMVPPVVVAVAGGLVFMARGADPGGGCS